MYILLIIDIISIDMKKALQALTTRNLIFLWIVSGEPRAELASLLLHVCN